MDIRLIIFYANVTVQTEPRFGGDSLQPLVESLHFSSLKESNACHSSGGVHGIAR